MSSKFCTVKSLVSCKSFGKWICQDRKKIIRTVLKTDRFSQTCDVPCIKMYTFPILCGFTGNALIIGHRRVKEIPRWNQEFSMFLPVWTWNNAIVGGEKSRPNNIRREEIPWKSYVPVEWYSPNCSCSWTYENFNGR